MHALPDTLCFLVHCNVDHCLWGEVIRRDLVVLMCWYMFGGNADTQKSGRGAFLPKYRNLLPWDLQSCRKQ